MVKAGAPAPDGGHFRSGLHRYVLELNSPTFVKRDLGGFYRTSWEFNTVKIPPNPPLEKGGDMRSNKVVVVKLKKTPLLLQVM